MKKVRVIFSPEAEEIYKYLNEQSPNSKTESMILNAVNKKIELIKLNMHYGNPIAKKLIPEVLKNYSFWHTENARHFRLNTKSSTGLQTYSELNFLNFGACFIRLQMERQK